MKTLKLILLADRQCSTSRTYLHYLKMRGFGVEKIILIDFQSQSRPHDWLKRTLPLGLSTRLLCYKKHTVSPFSKPFKAACDFFQNYVPYPMDYEAPFPWHTYIGDILNITAKDFNDPFLHKVMNAQKTQAFLYTNGGIVPPSVLNVPGRRIFHIHPGVVPHVKGSDGLLWSVLMRKKMGASCFYMNAGIDTGAILKTKEWNVPSFAEGVIDGLSQEDLYRALLYSFDPHLRAELFCDVIDSSPHDLLNRPSLTQDPKDGRTYYAMHRDMQFYALKSMGLSCKIPRE